MLKDIITLFLCSIMLSVFLMTLIVGIHRVEVAECLKWQAQAIVYPGFFLTESEAAQCEAHEIIINTPIHGDTD